MGFEVLRDAPLPIWIGCAIGPRFRLASNYARQPDRRAVIESPPRLLEIADEIGFQLIRIIED